MSESRSISANGRGTTFIYASLSQNLTEWPLSTAIEVMYPFPLPQEFYDRIEEFYPRDGTGWYVR